MFNYTVSVLFETTILSGTTRMQEAHRIYTCPEFTRAPARDWHPRHDRPHHYSPSCIDNHPMSRVPITSIYAAAARAYDAGNPDATRQLLLPLAQAGDAAAQYGLGLLYAFGGDDLPQDYGAARQWFEKAAAQQHGGAQYHLGLLYLDGQGVMRDDHKAWQWFERAARQDDARAQSYLGWMYDNGYGAPRDFATARHWLERAAAQGDIDAQYNLGDYYRYGKSVAEDLAIARQWYERAAAQGDSDAKRALYELRHKTLPHP